MTILHVPNTLPHLLPSKSALLCLFCFASEAGILRCSHGLSCLTPCSVEVVLITVETTSKTFQVELIPLFENGLMALSLNQSGCLRFSTRRTDLTVSVRAKRNTFHFSWTDPSTFHCSFADLLANLPLGVSFPSSSRLGPASLDTSNLCGLACLVQLCQTHLDT